MADLRRVPFRVGMRVAVGDVIERSGILIEGPAGWGEWSPLPSWDDEQIAAAERAALEAATLAFPEPVREVVTVNAMIPRVAPDEAATMALAAGCGTVKVKVGDPDSVERVHAVRDALGPDVKIRLDANGAWDADTASLAMAQLTRLDIELIEDPAADPDDIARIRRGSSILIAAESCVRTIADAKRLRTDEVADVFVVKPQRIGGMRAALAAAEESDLPTIASSALETSVGLSAVLAVAAALPNAPFAHGVGTARMLSEDVTDEPLEPTDGELVPRRVAPRAGFGDD